MHRALSLILNSTLLFSLVGCAAAPLQQAVRPTANLQAASSQRSPEGVRKGVIQLRKIRFDKWDTKPQDGLLTRAEVDDRALTLPNGLINGFDDYDVNRDGQITFQEFLREEVIHFWMELYLDIVDSEFVIRDRDNNGVLSGPELPELKELFARWPELNGGDLDHDGQVSYSEFQDAYMQVAPYLNLNARQVPQA